MCIFFKILKIYCKSLDWLSRVVKEVMVSITVLLISCLAYTRGVLTSDVLTGLSQELHFPDDLWCLSVTEEPQEPPVGWGQQPQRQGCCSLYHHERQSQAQNLTPDSFHLFFHLGGCVLSRHCRFLALVYSLPISQYTRMGWFLWFTLSVQSRSKCDQPGFGYDGRGFGSRLYHLLFVNLL